RREFSEKLGIPTTETTNSMWYPDQYDYVAPSNFRWIEEGKRTHPKYPIYIPSKGRWDLEAGTAKSLDDIHVLYWLVVEPKEYENYIKRFHPSKVLKLPEDFSEQGNGSIPVRNWIWERSLSRDEPKHWIIDDNVYAFARLNINRRIRVDSGAIFRAAEVFTDRYDNVAFSGFNYN